MMLPPTMLDHQCQTGAVVVMVVVVVDTVDRVFVQMYEFVVCVTSLSFHL